MIVKENKLGEIADRISRGANGVSKWYTYPLNRAVWYSNCVRDFLEELNIYSFIIDLCCKYRHKTKEEWNIIMLQVKANKYGNRGRVFIFWDYNDKLSVSENYKKYGIYRSTGYSTNAPVGEVKFYFIRENGEELLLFPEER